MHGIRNAPAVIHYLFLLVYLSQIVTLSGVLVEYQLRCPNNEKDWEERSNSYICQGDAVYHCMQNEDGRYVTFCASSIWIQPDYCPEFNSKQSAIDVILCPGALDKCPGKVFLSNAIYKYPSCFRTVIRTTTKSTTSGANTTTSSISWSKAPANDGQNAIPWLSILLIVLGIFLPFIVITIIVLMLRRRRYSRKNEHRKYSGDTEEGTESLMDTENNTTTKQSNDMKVNTVIYQNNVSDVQTKDREHKENFVKPANYSEAVEKVKKEGYVVLYGVSGSGKSTLAQYIVKNEFPEHQVLHLRGKQKHAPKYSSDGGLLFWDDCFGIWNISDNENKGDILKYMKEIIDKCRRNPQTYKAVLCSDSFFFDVDQFRGIASTMDLDKNYDSQVRMERFSDEMARNKKFLIKKESTEVGFPLLISLMLEDQYLEDNKDDFLKNPTSVLQERFQNILKDHIDVYVTLIYAVCNCPVNLQKVSKKKWDILKKECEKDGSCESEKEDKNIDSENSNWSPGSLKNAENKSDSEISVEGNIQVPTTGDHSEKSKESENCAPHRHKMGGGYKIANDANEETDDCVRDSKNADRNSADDNIEMKRSKVEDNANNLRSRDRSSTKFNVKSIKILKRHKTIEMNETLAKYLVKNESQDAQFEFRHQFLAESLLRFHINHFGKIGVSKAANEEVAFVLKNL